MCWSPTVTAAMVGAGAVATGISLAKRQPAAISATLGYFTLMEGLQVVGYAVIDQCGQPVNQVITLLSFLHITFQPFFINAFAMELVAVPVRAPVRWAAFTACGVSAAVMLAQLYPFEWAGACRLGSILCGKVLCTVTGDWHQAWDIPFNGMLNAFDMAMQQMIGLSRSFPTYLVVAFIVPLFYGAWRFVVFHALIGPLLAGTLTSNPNEIPAIWCLLSIGLSVIALTPPIRRRFSTAPA
jgi:hypothetical protein